jgi:hypothetical protein
MILRERVGGDGRVKGLGSGSGFGFLVLVDTCRLEGLPFVASRCDRALVSLRMCGE